jgi:hypothetical protein
VFIRIGYAGGVPFVSLGLGQGPGGGYGGQGIPPKHSVHILHTHRLRYTSIQRCAYSAAGITRVSKRTTRSTTDAMHYIYIYQFVCSNHTVASMHKIR